MKKIFILFPFLFIYGCKDNPSSENNMPVSNIIVPLSVGNQWITRLDMYDTNGVVIETKYDTLTIIKDTMVNGEKWYASNKEPFIYNTNRDDGVYTNIQSPRLVLNYPAKVNDSLMLSIEDSTQFLKVISVNDTIKLFGKSFVTYKYKFYFSKPKDQHVATYYYYYAPNVGLLKYEIVANHYSPKKYLWGKMETISYVIK